MKVGLFFGSFDPPHAGHIDLVTSALNTKVVDWVMVIPAWQNVWKSNSSKYELRLVMCQRAFQSLAVVSDVESKIDNKGSTYDVIKYLRNQYTSYGLDKVVEFVMLTTCETWKEIPKWENGDKLLTEIPIIVEGIDFHASGIPIHSTNVRDMIKQGKLPQPAISHEVYNLIRSNKLYT